MRMAGVSWLPRLLLGLGLGALGGALFAFLHLPLPWMIGSMVAVAGARLLGLPAEASRSARNAGFVVVAMALGLYFTPAASGVLLANLPLLVGAALSTLALGGILALLLARTGKVDPATAWFASIPGGAADMAMLSEHYGGRAAPVAVAQLLRVVCIVVAVPNLMAMAGLRGDLPRLATATPFWLPGFVLLFALGLPGGLRIFPSALQAIVNILDHGMSVQEAVEAPRVWTEGGVLEVEDRIDPAVTDTLAAMGHDVVRVPRIAGGMNAIARDADGTLTGAACWRADGTPVGIAGGLARAGVRFTAV